MATLLARKWWALALRGLAALIFGLLMFVWPLISLEVLVLFFGGYAMADGLLSIVATAKAQVNSRRWWSLLVGGVLSFIIGLLTFIWPGITALVLLYLIAFRAILLGVFEVAAAIRLRRLFKGEWLLAIGGVISILFGLILLIYPAAGAIAVVWLIGLYSLVAGITLLALAFKLRSFSYAGKQDVFTGV